VSDAASGSRFLKISSETISIFEESLFRRFAASDVLSNVVFEKKNYSYMIGK
jgi:hypothetical protein